MKKAGFQIQGQLTFDQDPQTTQCGAAQAEGIFVASGSLADGEDAQQSVQLVSDGQDPARVSLRQGGPGAPGLILLVQGPGDFLRLSGDQGVMPPHDPLQLRKLAHQVRQQIALGQPGGPLHRRGVKP